mmetsp:Transcript_15413/g.29073  ORF Transcript_15413/g.29073 Transcript_15413/m.29073 type:complete len:107 (+) Transcript_15413:1270-1590(+)
MDITQVPSLSGGLGEYNASVSVEGNAFNPGGLFSRFDGTITAENPSSLGISIPNAEYQVLSTPIFLKTSKTGEKEATSLDIRFLDENYLIIQDERGSWTVFERAVK